jgi:hypothetical protein
MLSPERIAELADRIVHGHQEAFVRDLTERLIRSLASDGDLSVKDMRLLEQVAASNRNELTRLHNMSSAKISDEARESIIEALADAEAWDLAVIGAAHPGAMLSGSSLVAARIAQQTAEGLARIIARDNLALSSRAQSVWYDVTGEAITRYNGGAYSTDRIITDAVRRLRAEGFVTIDYASGVKSAPDVAVRRHVITQAQQASGRITDEILDAVGHEPVMTSAHLGARPDHLPWQGRAFRRGGPGVVEGERYEGFEEATGLGTVTGLAGANCRHSYGPYWPGISELPEVPKPPGGLSEEEYYDLTQKQRGYERAIRKTKAEIADLRLVGADDTNARLKLGNQQRRLKAFCDKTDLPRIRMREKAYAIGGQPKALRKARAVRSKALDVAEALEGEAIARARAHELTLMKAPGPTGMKLGGKPSVSGQYLTSGQKTDLSKKSDSLVRSLSKRFEGVTSEDSALSEARYIEFDMNDEYRGVVRISNHSGSGAAHGHATPDFDLRVSDYATWGDLRKEVEGIFDDLAIKRTVEHKAASSVLKVGSHAKWGLDDVEVIETGLKLFGKDALKVRTLSGVNKGSVATIPRSFLS